MARRNLYIVYSSEHCALLYLPRGMASEDYERLRGFFGRFVNASEDDFVSIIKLHDNDCKHEIWYSGELAGPGGMSYLVFQLPKQTNEQADACERHLRCNQDVVRLRIMRFKRDHSIDVQAIANRMFARLHDFGTWHVGKGNGEGAVFADDGRMKFAGHGTTLSPICQVCDFEGDKELLLNLIAAAPELLRDLELLVNWCGQIGGVPREMLAQANRSIAKARGENLPQ